MEPGSVAGEHLSSIVKIEPIHEADVEIVPLKDELLAEENISIVNYMPPPTVTIKPEPLENRNNSAAVNFTDSGCSESEEDLDEDVHPLASETVGDQSSAKPVIIEQLSSEDETALESSVEIEEFSLKVESEDDSFLFVDGLDSISKNEEEERRKVPQEITDSRTVSEKGELITCWQGQVMSTNQSVSETKGSHHCGQFGCTNYLKCDKSNLHVKGKKNKSEHCGGQFFNSAEQHERTVHLQEMKYQCKHCRQFFTTKQNMQLHVRAVHLKEQYKCEQCGQLFNYNSSVKRHVRAVHLKQRYKCEQCGQLFNYSKSVKEHVRAVHQKGQQCKCEHCGQLFEQHSLMKQHERVVHLNKKLYDCAQCGQLFGQRHHMKQHVTAIHLKEKNYKCVHCFQLFGNSHHLKEHVRTVHLKEKYECEYCRQLFNYRSYVKKHIQVVHLKEKKYKCLHCEHLFGHSHHLKQHVRTIHLKEKYECEHCKQLFSSRHYMKKHARTVHPTQESMNVSTVDSLVTATT